jgi:hypothetical protein
VLSLYLLERVGEVPYDRYGGFVVCASGPYAARRIVSAEVGWAGQEEIDVWMRASGSSLRRIGHPTPKVRPGIVMSDVRNG